MLNRFNNGNLEFHDSILITGDSDERLLNSNRNDLNTSSGNNTDGIENLSTELAMSSASVYLT